MSGQGWTPPDTILQDATAGLLPIQQLGPKAPQAIQDFFDLWRALPPWPDVAAGMQALHKHYTLAVLSNMSIATQTRLRAHAGLPFDKLLSGETVKAYKPNAAVYQMAVSSLNIRPAEILMVAAHNYDLNAANGQGFSLTESESRGPPPLRINYAVRFGHQQEGCWDESPIGGQQQVAICGLCRRTCECDRACGPGRPTARLLPGLDNAVRA